MSQGKEGFGPDESDLSFDFNPGPLTSHWNYACADILLDNTPIDYPKPRLDRQAYVEMMMDKLKRLKNYYNEGQPRNINGILETEEEIMDRIGVRDGTLRKRVRANQRMRTVSYSCDNYEI